MAQCPETITVGTQARRPSATVRRAELAEAQEVVARPAEATQQLVEETRLNLQEKRFFHDSHESRSFIHRRNSIITIVELLL